MTIIPPYLKKGDCIGITCPAGYMAQDKITACVETLNAWGFEVIVGKTVGSQSTNYFSGTDEERLQELQRMMDDKKINAILFGRGGYGVGRIIDRINFKKFSKKPKWLIGYSDITVLHNHLFSKYNIASLHAPMGGAFNDKENGQFFLDTLHETVTGQKLSFTTDPHPFNKKGEAKGILVGGNLSLLTNMIGTPSDIDTKNKILFLEDVGEYLYKIDRMMYQLKRSGKFAKLAGLIIGGFTEMKDTERPFGKDAETIIQDIIQSCNYPVCFDFPISHTSRNLPVKSGGMYRLKVSGKKTVLEEL